LANHLAGVEENGRDVDRIDSGRYMMAVLVVLRFFLACYEEVGYKTCLFTGVGICLPLMCNVEINQVAGELIRI
jgi:hypothetical protein